MDPPVSLVPRLTIPCVLRSASQTGAQFTLSAASATGAVEIPILQMRELRLEGACEG